MNKTPIYILLFILLFSLKSIGQDAQFSQFYSNPLYISPSFAGSTKGTRAVLNFRDQWPGIPGAFITYSASVDHFFPRYNSGVGIQIYKDQAGSGQLGLTSVALNYAYQFNITRHWVLRPGLMLNYNQRSIDFNKLVFNDQMHIDGNSPSSIESSSAEKIQFLDAGFSMMAFNRDYWFGLSIDNLFYTNESFIDGEAVTPVKYRFYGGRKIIIANAKRYNQESIDVAMNLKFQKQFAQLDIGAYWSKDPFIFGLWYRGIPLLKNYASGYINNDALIILLGYKYKELTLAYSYDITVSRIFANTYGAHEVSVIFKFNQDQKVRKKRNYAIIPCPKF